MRALLAVPLLLALLAGCAGSDRDDGPSPGLPGGDEARDAQRPRLAAPTLLPPVSLGDGVGEPNIAAAPDGTLYVADPGINVWRSDDGGRSFTKTAARNIEGGGDGDLVATADGRLHWLGLFGEAGPIPYQVSADRGASFSDAVDLSNETGSDREWLGSSRDRSVLYASWRGQDPDEGAVIHTTASHDGGASWTPLVVLADDAIGGPIVGGARHGQVFEALTTFGDAEGLGLVGTGGSAIQLARSFDHGATWDLVPVAVPEQSVAVGLIGFATSIFPVVAADDAGTLYVVFSADQRMLPQAVPKPASRFGVFLTSSADLGETWTAPVLLSDPDHVALMPWIDAGAPGRVAVTWYENTLGLPADVLPDLWNVKLWQSVTADQALPQGLTVQLNDQPSHVGAVCTSGTGCLAGDRSLLDFFEVVLTPDGRAVATWTFSAAGTGVGVSAMGPTVYVGGVAAGTPLR